MVYYLQCSWMLFVLLQPLLAVLVSMRGGEYITHDISGNSGIHLEKLHVVFQFKTIDPSSLILFSQNTYLGDYISIELIDGKLLYKGRLGFDDEKGEQELVVGNGLNNDNWHVVDLQLNERNVSIELDYKKTSKSFGGEYSRLDLDETVYFGGLEERIDVSSYKITRRKYSGCLKNFFFNDIDILYHAKYSKPGYATKGDLVWNTCEDVDYQPIMFKNPQDHTLLPTYLENSLSVSFKFRTHIGKGLMFSKISQAVSVSLELKDSSLFLNVQIGKGKGPIIMTKGMNLDDGFWHRVEILVDKKIIKFKVDNHAELTHESPFSHLVAFRQSNATLGGGEEQINQGFVGCMYNIWVDDTMVDYKKLSPSYSMGVLKKCELSDKCLFSPCRHGGKCSQDHKSFKCDCFNTMYSGQTCEKSIYQPSCQEYKDMGLNEDAYCTIDPDGDLPRVKPFKVLCNMTRYEKKAVTIFEHNLKNAQISVAKGLIEGTSYHHNLNYEVDIETFDILLKNAIHCRQHVQFKCKNAYLMKSPRGPPDTVWVGRKGSNEEYWGGAKPGSGMCACRYDKSCAQPYKYCNCDIGDDVWRSDEGYFNQTERLPVVMMSFKLTANQSFFSVGNLECQFNSTTLPQNMSKIRVLKACNPLNEKSTTRPVITGPSLKQKEKPMSYYNRRTTVFEFGIKPTQKVILERPYKVNVNVTVELPKMSNQPDGLKFTLSVYAVIVIAVATVIVVIIIAAVIIAKRCQRRQGGGRNDDIDIDDEREVANEMCTFFGSYSRAESNRPVIEVHRHSIHCDTLDELPPAYREYVDFPNQPITTHIDLSYKPRKKSFGIFC